MVPDRIFALRLQHVRGKLYRPDGRLVRERHRRLQLRMDGDDCADLLRRLHAPALPPSAALHDTGVPGTALRPTITYRIFALHRPRHHVHRYRRGALCRRHRHNGAVPCVRTLASGGAACTTGRRLHDSRRAEGGRRYRHHTGDTAHDWRHRNLRLRSRCRRRLVSDDGRTVRRADGAYQAGR